MESLVSTWLHILVCSRSKDSATLTSVICVPIFVWSLAVHYCQRPDDKKATQRLGLARGSVLEHEYYD